MKEKRTKEEKQKLKELAKVDDEIRRTTIQIKPKRKKSKLVLGIIAISLAAVTALSGIAIGITRFLGNIKKSNTDKTNKTTITSEVSLDDVVSDNKTNEVSENSETSEFSEVSEIKVSKIETTNLTSKATVITRATDTVVTQTTPTTKKTESSKVTQSTKTTAYQSDTAWDGSELIACPRDYIDPATGEVAFKAGQLVEKDNLEMFEEYIRNYGTYITEPNEYIVGGLVFQSEADYNQWVSQGRQGYIEENGIMVPIQEEMSTQKTLSR